MREGAEIRLPAANAVLVQTITTAAVIDLAAAGDTSVESAGFASNISYPGTASQPTSSSGGGTAVLATLQPSGFVGKWVMITIDGSDLGIIAGPTSASVSAGNAPVLANTGNPGTAGTCERLFQSTRNPYYVTPDTRFIGVVSAGTTTLRISTSSRPS
jgi:hypothetical protein